jgi:hypothetical protein
MVNSKRDLVLDFHKRDQDDWASECIAGLLLELIRVDHEWLASATVTYDPYGETQHLELTTSAGGMREALSKLFALPGLPYYLAMSESITDSIRTLFPRIFVRWGTGRAAQVQNLASSTLPKYPRVLRFKQLYDDLWVAYYGKHCRIGVRNEDAVWVAEARSIRADGPVESLRALGASCDEAVFALVGMPGIPALFGLSSDPRDSLKRFIQSIELVWIDRRRPVKEQSTLVSRLACPTGETSCGLDPFTGECSRCGDPYTSSGWAYTMRWDD